MTRAAETSPRSAVPGPIASSPWLSAIWLGFGAAAVGAFVAVCASLVLWIPDASATGTSGSTMRAGLITFLAAQRGGVTINGTQFGFVPFGLTLMALWLCWRAGRSLTGLAVVADEISARRQATIAGLAAATYVITCAAVVPFARVGTSSVPLISALRGAVLVAAVGFTAAAVTDTELGDMVRDRCGERARTAWRAASASTLVLLAGGALLAAMNLVHHAGRFMDFSRGLARGVSGLPIALLDITAAPNAAVAGSAYIAGPGFAVGRDSTYAPFGGHGGLVPSFPILAALPSGPRATYPVLVLMVLVVLAAGTVAGTLVRRDDPDGSWLSAAATCLFTAVIAGVQLALLCAATGGSLGAHRLSAVGASSWRVGLAVTAEMAVVGVVAMTAARLRAARRQRDLVSNRVTTKPATNAVAKAPAAEAPAPAAKASAGPSKASTDPAKAAKTEKVPTAKAQDADAVTEQLPTDGKAQRAS